jgi:hypothetical protein
MKVGFQIHTPTILIRANTSKYQHNRMLFKPQIWCGYFGIDTNFLPRPGFNWGLLVV